MLTRAQHLDTNGNPIYLTLQVQRSSSRSDFFSPRPLIALLVCAVGCWIATGTVLAFFHSKGSSRVSPRTLTFADRVAYQRAIEEVYWRHRIWPKERPDPKPTLDAVMSQAQLEKKVEDYLRNSQALKDYWQRPLTAEQLQAEMERMALHTKQPEVLRELFEALGNDPSVIAECLARPVLSERLVTNFYAHDERFHGKLRQRAEADLRTHYTVGEMKQTSGKYGEIYTLPKIAEGTGNCVDDTWTATGIPVLPEARSGHTAVWTGSEMIVWCGLNDNTGLRYNPGTDSWTATSTTNAPEARALHTVVWTGNEMIVWGGRLFSGLSTNTGARYNPTSDSWTATSTSNVPTGRNGHTAVWTGSEMVVWSGSGQLGYLTSGGKYNPSTNTWTATSETNVPDRRVEHTAVWTGSEMIVWGGFSDLGIFNTGGKYNPSTNTWTATSTTNAPEARYRHTAVWTGSEMIVWGGGGYFNTGGKYNPSANTWTATSITNAPEARRLHTAVWTGNEIIAWGGEDENHFPLNTGGRYNPGTDSWIATITPTERRDNHTAVWTGNQMIVWGGSDDFGLLNTGGRYCAQVGPTPTPTATVTPTPTSTPRPTPTPRLQPTPRPRPTPPPRP